MSGPRDMLEGEPGYVSLNTVTDLDTGRRLPVVRMKSMPGAPTKRNLTCVMEIEIAKAFAADLLAQVDQCQQANARGDATFFAKMPDGWTLEGRGAFERAKRGLTGIVQTLVTLHASAEEGARDPIVRAWAQGILDQHRGRSHRDIMNFLLDEVRAMGPKFAVPSPAVDERLRPVAALTTAKDLVDDEPARLYAAGCAALGLRVGLALRAYGKHDFSSLFVKVWLVEGDNHPLLTIDPSPRTGSLSVHSASVQVAAEAVREKLLDAEIVAPLHAPEAPA